MNSLSVRASIVGDTTTAMALVPSSSTGAKLFTGSKGSLGRTAGTVECEVAVNIRVWPSGAALAAASLPMTPAAPARFSVTTVTPQRSLSLAPSSRARVSAVVPVL